jgi:UPF0271 protein
LKAIILDASAFIQGYESSKSDTIHYTVPAVKEELKDEITLLRYESSISSSKLREVQPEPAHVKRLEGVAKEMGEAHKLSHADKQLLSLGLQLMAEGKEPVIVSDDYSVQNMADRLGIGYRGLATRGIKRRLRWSIYCPGCRRTYDLMPEGGVCLVCGTELKRKPTRVGK